MKHLFLGLVVAAMFVVRAGALSSDQADARSALLRNVRAVDSGGVPGVVLCVGTNAFPVVGATCGQAVQPVVAASFYGNGRVVAVGHPSFYTEGVAKADTATFVRNAVFWLGNGQAEIRSYRDKSVARALGGIEGLNVREIPSLDALSSGDVLAVYPDSLKPDEVERVRAFIVDGGGLLAAGIGWGWQQVSGGKSLATENLFNRLLGPAGLLINADYAGRTAPDGYLAGFPLPEGVNIAEALRLAMAGGVTDRAVQRQINHSLCAVKSVLPPEGCELADGLKVLMASPAAAKLPAPDAPLKAGDIPARLALIEHQLAWRAAPLGPWPAHPAAAAYPGVPPKEMPRGNRTLTVDLDVPRWRGTGLYAAAGEPVTVELPPGAERLGLKLRIGTTTCDNTRHDEWRRAPKVDIEVPLATNRVTISSPFGGLLYLVVPNGSPRPPGAEGRSVQVTLRNACQSVWFKKGRDTPAAWRTSIRKIPSPWAEIESDKIVLTVPADVVRGLDDPLALLAFWEKIADQDARLTGLPPERRSAERFCADVQLCAGWMHAGYPIMVPVSTAKDLVNLEKLRKEGDWGFFHELGHNHQNGDWTFQGTGEVTVNFFTLYNMEHACGIPPRKTRMGEEGIQKKVRQWVAEGKPHDAWCRDPFLALEVFVRLQQAFGWGAFERLFAEYRPLDAAQRPKSDADKRDQWAVRLSRVTGSNIAAVFDAWNIPVTETARQACAAYPKPADPRLFDGL
jgi:hypothetical protein